MNVTPYKQRGYDISSAHFRYPDVGLLLERYSFLRNVCTETVGAYEEGKKQMIQPIQPMIIGPSGGAGSVSPAQGSTGGSGATAAVSSTMAGQSLQISNVNISVGQMLQGIGGGVENDKILQMLIALMILMALLQNLQQQQGGSSQGSSSGSGLDASQFLGQTMSSSSMTFEQSTITLSSMTVTGAYQTTGEQPQTSGQQIDVPA